MTTPLWFWDWRPSAEETLVNWGLQLQRDEIEEVFNRMQSDDTVHVNPTSPMTG